MYRLSIPALSCGHCVATITKAVRALDADAGLQFDLKAHNVDVSTSVALDSLTARLAEAGYPVAAVTTIPTVAG